MKITIPDNVRLAIGILEQNGYSAYAVGGCVRDSLLGHKPYDWDICTSALTEQMEECFADFRIIPTGVKHGTLTIIVDEPLEITTFRIDGDYLDNRRPSDVSFTRNLSDDLCRRDFTVNAMALNSRGEITDLYGGREDLEAKRIRCVGDASTRFDEDALRIMRALRFASTLGFEIEEKTASAIHAKKHLLKNIAAERIQKEFTKLLTGNCCEVHLKTVSGDCDFEGTADKLFAKSTSGDFTLHLRNMPCAMELNTVSGDTRLYLPDNDGFALRYQRVSGEVRSDFNLKTSLNDKSGTAIYLEGGGRAYSMQTVSGDLRIYRR